GAVLLDDLLQEGGGQEGVAVRKAVGGCIREGKQVAGPPHPAALDRGGDQALRLQRLQMLPDGDATDAERLGQLIGGKGPAPLEACQNVVPDAADRWFHRYPQWPQPTFISITLLGRCLCAPRPSGSRAARRSCRERKGEQAMKPQRTVD